jgi:hypothetical protein
LQLARSVSTLGSSTLGNRIVSDMTAELACQVSPDSSYPDIVTRHLRGSLLEEAVLPSALDKYVAHPT